MIQKLKLNQGFVFMFVSFAASSRITYFLPVLIFPDATEMIVAEIQENKNVTFQTGFSPTKNDKHFF